jgi:DUF1680 family protein
MQFTPHGIVGDRVRVNENNWLIPAPTNNPGMLGMFAHRNDQQYMARERPVFWAGEFAGKYLISAVQSLKMTGNPDLARVVSKSVSDLIASQGTDGSLGMPLAWDLWGQYHVMLGLLAWHDYRGDQAALNAARRAADLACARYLHRPGAIATDNPGEEEKNQAFAHGLAVLYLRTNEQRYLDLLRAIVAEWRWSGNYIAHALEGREFFNFTKHRWESLHDVQAIAELFRITGEQHYRDAFTKIWTSIKTHDARATGGFSSYEEARGNPWDPRYIETCGTVAWSILSADMLRMTDDPLVADELEISLFNGVLGAQSPDGRHWTYHTPMGGIPIDDSDSVSNLIGYRWPAFYNLDWQGRFTYPQLSCCSANGPRGIGNLVEWAVRQESDVITLNYLGASTINFRLPSGSDVRVKVETQYPASGTVRLVFDNAVPITFTLRIRIPRWSATVRTNVNGQTVGTAVPGTYWVIRREWRRNDVVSVELDTSVRVVEGRRDAAGRAVAYRGPLLLTYDARGSSFNLSAMPKVALRQQPSISQQPSRAIVEATFQSSGGPITLVDFLSAGQSPSANLPARPNPAVPWQFIRRRAGEQDMTIAQQLRLRSDGGISGYASPNESRWSFDGDILTFFAADGRPTTRFTMRTEQNGAQILTGWFLPDPSICHVLHEIPGFLTFKRWHFWRHGNPPVALARQMTLMNDGTISGSSHANESRWGYDGDTLVFQAANGAISTRWEKVTARNGRLEFEGRFLFDGSIRHGLTEIDADPKVRVWRFLRGRSGTDVTEPHPIADNVRLRADQRLDGHRHSNETSWGMEGGVLVFRRADGALSTKFDQVKMFNGRLRLSGEFLLGGGGSIRHVLEEIGGSSLPSYVTWLPIE